MLLKIILIYFLLVNLVTFIIWGVDKMRAVKQRRRISEKTLLVLTLIGGFVGAILGMQFFHHKTIKSKFLIYFRSAVAVWFVILGILFYFYMKS